MEVADLIIQAKIWRVLRDWDTSTRKTINNAQKIIMVKLGAIFISENIRVTLNPSSTVA